MTSHSPVSEIQDFVSRLNAAWLGQRFGELLEYFHPDVVVLTPDLSTRVHGREACVASYRDFMAGATVHSCRHDPAQVDATGNTAVAVVPYEIDYEIPSGRWSSVGKELLVLGKAGDAWVVVWRFLIPGEEVPVHDATAASR